MHEIRTAQNTGKILMSIESPSKESFSVKEWFLLQLCCNMYKLRMCANILCKFTKIKTYSVEILNNSGFIPKLVTVTFFPIFKSR